MEGLGEGTTFPALNTLVSAWIPVRERSKAGALIFGGSQVIFQYLKRNIVEN